MKFTPSYLVCFAYLDNNFVYNESIPNSIQVCTDLFGIRAETQKEITWIKEAMNVKLETKADLSELLDDHTLTTPEIITLLNEVKDKNLNQLDAKKGESARYVMATQSALSMLGYYHGPINAILDRSTSAALKNFQTTHYLIEANGVPGPESFVRLISALNENENCEEDCEEDQKESKQINNPNSHTPLLSEQISKDFDIKHITEKYTKDCLIDELKLINSANSTLTGGPSCIEVCQFLLKKEGFYSRNIDGDNGPGTKDAIKKYQKQRNIEVSGDIDKKTIISMLAPKDMKEKSEIFKLSEPDPQNVSWSDYKGANNYTNHGESFNETGCIALTNRSVPGVWSKSAWHFGDTALTNGAVMKIFNTFDGQALPKTNNIKNIRKYIEERIKENSISLDSVKVGDVVGIYNSTSSFQLDAFNEGSKLAEKSINSHVGQITENEGQMYVTHNMGGTIYSEKLTENYLSKITSVYRPINKNLKNYIKNNSTETQTTTENQIIVRNQKLAERKNTNFELEIKNETTLKTPAEFAQSLQDNINSVGQEYGLSTKEKAIIIKASYGSLGIEGAYGAYNENIGTHILNLASSLTSVGSILFNQQKKNALRAVKFHGEKFIPHGLDIPFLGKIATTKGLTQININNIPQKLRKKYKIINEDDLFDTRKSAIATMIIHASHVKTLKQYQRNDDEKNFTNHLLESLMLAYQYGPTHIGKKTKDELDYSIKNTPSLTTGMRHTENIQVAITKYEQNESISTNKYAQRAIDACNRGDKLKAIHCTDWVSKIFEKNADYGRAIYNSTHVAVTGKISVPQPAPLQSINTVQPGDYLLAENGNNATGSHGMIALENFGDGRIKVASWSGNKDLKPSIEVYNFHKKDVGNSNEKYGKLGRIKRMTA